ERVQEQILGARDRVAEVQRAAVRAYLDGPAGERETAVERDAVVTREGVAVGAARRDETIERRARVAVAERHVVLEFDVARGRDAGARCDGAGERRRARAGERQRGTGAVAERGDVADRAAERRRA